MQVLQRDADAIVWTCSPFHGNSPLHPVSRDLTAHDEPIVGTGEAQRLALFETIAKRLALRATTKPTAW